MIPLPLRSGERAVFHGKHGAPAAPAGSARYPARATASRAACASSSASPGTGKSVIKHALCQHDPKRIITPVVNRTLHTYHSTLRILCEAFRIETDGADFRCEKRLIEEARRLNGAGKMLAPIIDDAHLIGTCPPSAVSACSSKISPKNHCLVLVAQPELLSRLALTVNEDIKNRVTYSALMQKLAPDSLADFIRGELDKVALAHSTFTVPSRYSPWPANVCPVPPGRASRISVARPT